MEAPIISGVAHERGEAKITVVGVPDKPGEAAQIFTAVADAGVNIDMIVQNVSSVATGSPTSRSPCPAPSSRSQRCAASSRAQAQIGFESLQYDDQIGKVSLVGAGMRSHPGVSARFFAALADAGHQRRDDLDVARSASRRHS